MASMEKKLDRPHCTRVSTVQELSATACGGRRRSARKPSPLLVVRQAYTLSVVNEYCSGYGKVAAIENLDSDFLMCVL